ncbi:MAG: hypothetical protein IKX53_02710 [Bacteroidales bacterium]|nr:hypothetical protein [Bacteroidales bacterium]
MKRTFFRALGAVLLFAVCIACEDRLEPVTQPDASAKHFMATTESPSTKTALSGNDTDGYEVNWQSGDQITVVDGAATPNVGIYTTTSTTPKGEFSFANSGAEATTAPYQAYYPATLYNAGTLTLPATQTYVPGNIGGSPMYATSENENLSFKNLCGIIRLNVSTTMSGKKIRKIILTATQGMSGAITNAATLASDNYKATVSGTTGVTLDCGQSGVAIGNDAVPFHFAVPANAYTGLKITVITTDGIFQTRTLKSDKSIVVERSSIADVTVSFNNMSATDLSAKGTANTYIVSAAGNYKFNATVKGNGGIDPLTGTKATAISGISGVKVLWELGDTYGKTIKYYGSAYDINYADGYVYFSTPDNFQNGDAYVAVVDDSDNILWSWLIWATDAPSTTTYNDLGIMDRNLGATATGNVACRGMMYEWGRKDPFPSPNNGSYNPNTFVPDRMTAFSISNFDAEGMTVAYSIAHPTTYTKGWAELYWQTASEYTTEMWWKDAKTIYDPCPSGWKVPNKDEMQIVVNSGVNLPGNGFIGNVSTDFGYGNPGSQYYWTSTGYDRNRAWGYHGGIVWDHVDDATRSGWSIRPVVDLDAVDLSDYTDLSAAATANSYIVAAAGDYKFNATVKGNGSANLAGISKTTAATDISKAELVWASYGTTTAPAIGELIRRIGYKDGYVFFSTGNAGYREGNAVVAIKDASGNILWSWHLWFESDNLESLKQTYPGGAVFMDRDLGARAPAVAAATDDIDAYGLLYQWGRKDPFLNTWYTSKYGNTDGTKGLPAVQGSIEQRLGTFNLAYTVAEVVQYPFRFYYSSHYSINGEGTSQWATDMVDGMWSSDKTIFDPCPAGWRVPDLSDWNDDFMTLFSGNSFDGDGNNIPRGYTGLSVDIGGSQTAFFPVSGLRYRGKLTWYMSGTTYTRCYGNGGVESPMDYHLHYWAQDGLLVRTDLNGVEQYNRNTKLSYSELSNSTTYPETLSGGFSVRCVKE